MTLAFQPLVGDNVRKGAVKKRTQLGRFFIDIIVLSMALIFSVYLFA